MKPVVNHELNPGCSKQVQCGSGFKVIARQELTADRSRTRLQKRSFFRVDLIEREVPSEPGAGRAHSGHLEIVVSPIRGAADERRRIAWTWVKRALRSQTILAVKIQSSKAVANPVQLDHAQIER